MPVNARHEHILSELDQKGFASVSALSALLRVSEVTIRRDLEQLEGAGRLRRTHGGALSLRPAAAPGGASGDGEPARLAERIDVLISTPVDPAFDRALLDRATQQGIPVIAESVAIPGAVTLVAPDNAAAGAELGRWAGEYACKHLTGNVRLLDLTYHLPNTQARSAGFLAGLREVLPAAQLVLSINSASAVEPAYRITRDVLSVHPEINMIFAINDATAAGALRACREAGIRPQDLALFTFGLEGETFLAGLSTCAYCRAALAMFPDIVGPVSVEASIAAYQGRDLPPHLVTPHVVLTAESLGEYYRREAQGWVLNWDTVRERLALPLPLDNAARSADLPERIGFVVPFSEHEWYRNVAARMYEHAGRYGIALEVIDAEQSRQEDLAMRQREIAQVAALQVQPGDVVLVDAGPITTYLAEELAGHSNLTVITNALPVIEALRDRPGITLIATGGLLRQGSDAFHGPTVELAIRELRADKLFLSASGVTPDFGISHEDLAEVSTKQAMIRVAREVILLADHTLFGEESIAQVAPLRVVSRVITDSALPAATRLELSKTGIEVIIARA